MSTVARFIDGPHAGMTETSVAGTPWLVRMPNPDRYADPDSPSFLAYRLVKVVAYYSLEGADSEQVG